MSDLYSQEHAAWEADREDPRDLVDEEARYFAEIRDERGSTSTTVLRRWLDDPAMTYLFNRLKAEAKARESGDQH
ncbi:hypothetical protein SAMN05445060_2791 [Williamsia sterculiae]|uniref:Uncharacterized protein n=1 Tax=Williamsia sterculiae TaxID=1344003 RepID=A0A1N7GHB9_9NOCA|nr:hypothetical protein SAMN05445060_2791 [Williamsia sterculiae]